MRPSDEARLIILKGLSHKTKDNLGVLNDVYSTLASKYEDLNWINDLLISMDINHDGFINLAFQQDAQGTLLPPIIPGGAKHLLTPNGEYELTLESN